MTVDNYIKLHLTITISSFFTQKGGIAQFNFQCKTNNLQYRHVHQDDYLNDLSKVNINDNAQVKIPQ